MNGLRPLRDSPCVANQFAGDRCGEQGGNSRAGRPYHLSSENNRALPDQVLVVEGFQTVELLRIVKWRIGWSGLNPKWLAPFSGAETWVHPCHEHRNFQAGARACLGIPHTRPDSPDATDRRPVVFFSIA